MLWMFDVLANNVRCVKSYTDEPECRSTRRDFVLHCCRYSVLPRSTIVASPNPKSHNTKMVPISG